MVVVVSGVAEQWGAGPFFVYADRSAFQVRRRTVQRGSPKDCGRVDNRGLKCVSSFYSDAFPLISAVSRWASSFGPPFYIYSLRVYLCLFAREMRDAFVPPASLDPRCSFFRLHCGSLPCPPHLCALSVRAISGIFRSLPSPAFVCIAWLISCLSRPPSLARASRQFILEFPSDAREPPGIDELAFPPFPCLPFSSGGCALLHRDAFPFHFSVCL